MTAGKVVQLAVLGTGGVAQVVHLPILTRMRGVALAGLHDSDQPKAATLAGRFSVPRVYGSTAEMWGDPALDAVIICTPNHAHEEQVLQGLEAGKYVFCEKPLSLTSKGAARAVKKAGREGRLMVGMNQRFRPDAAVLKSFVTAGELGDIHSVRAGLLNRRAARSTRHWRNRKEIAGGGALVDLGIQMLDLCLWLLDYPEPHRLVAHTHRPKGAEVEDSAVLLLEVAPGLAIDIEVTWSLVADREKQYLQVIGTRGSASLSPLKIFKDTEQGMLDVSPQLAPGRENQFTASYRQELSHFLDAVRAQAPIAPPAEQVTLMRLVEAAYRSVEQGAEVRI